MTYGWTDEQVLALPFSRLIRLIKMCSREEHKRYRLSMEPGVLVAWFLRNQNIAKESDFVPYDKFRKDFGLQSQDKQQIDKKKEIELAKANIQKYIGKTSFKEIKPEVIKQSRKRK